MEFEHREDLANRLLMDVVISSSLSLHTYVVVTQCFRSNHISFVYRGATEGIRYFEWEAIFHYPIRIVAQPKHLEAQSNGSLLSCFGGHLRLPKVV